MRLIGVIIAMIIVLVLYMHYMNRTRSGNDELSAGTPLEKIDEAKKAVKKYNDQVQKQQEELQRLVNDN